MYNYTAEDIADLIRSKNTRLSKMLGDFVEFCLQPQHSDLRFWQALSSWCKWPYIILTKNLPIKLDSELAIWRLSEIVDPYSWEENRKP